MTHAFISYSRKDTDFVNRLERDLNARGLLTWRDIHSIPGGAKWFRRIKSGLESSYAMLYIDTPNAEYSEWVEKEFLYGAAIGLPVIPVKIDAGFMSLHTINLNPILCDEANYAVGLVKIAAELAALPKKPVVPGALPPPEQADDAAPDESGRLPDHAQEVRDYLKWLLVKTHADLRDALYVRLQAAPERSAPRAPDPDAFDSGLDIDFEMGFDRLALERIQGEQFDRSGEEVTDARLPLHEMRRAILLGEPGAGKTTTLLQLAVDEARQAQAKPETARLPVFVPLREFDGRQVFEDFVSKRLYNLQDAYPDLHSAGRLLLLLLDALNEMPRRGADGRDLVAEVRDYLSESDKNAWVVSCRVRDYQEELSALRDAGKVRLKPLDPPRIYEVIRRRFIGQFAPQGIATAEDGEKLWQAMYGSDGLLKAWNVFVACGRADAFWGDHWPYDVKAPRVGFFWDTPGYGD
ncbi:MAG: hypothetical protein BroJett038_31320 [Chloroflexota bacterium]|nr:MAG: hypothetical protein BroJett038_31320 [Chloroflexota bacterium]